MNDMRFLLAVWLFFFFSVFAFGVRLWLWDLKIASVIVCFLASFGAICFTVSLWKHVKR